MKKKNHNQGLGPSQRQLRVGEELRHILSQALQRGNFHHEILMNEAHNLTVTEIRPSPDLKHATAYVMALGGVHMEELLKALNEEAYNFQKEINRVSSMKFTPKIRFRGDESFDEAARIDKILSELPPAIDQENKNDGTA